ncbi:MAG: PEP-CTERM sorting domain-containing protein [Phycisphaerae bacterium]
MKNMKHIQFAVAGLAALGLFRAALAATWDGYSTMLPGTTTAQRPELAGEVIASQDIVLHPGGANAWYPDAILHNYVVRETHSGTLDFYFQLTSTSPLTQNILQMGITGFDLGPMLDVDQIVPDTAYSQFFAARVETAGGRGILATGSPARGSGTFPLDPGASTAPLFVHTDATILDASGTFSFEGESIPGSTYAPLVGGAAPAPEPGTLMLLPLTLAALGLRRFRRA